MADSGATASGAGRTEYSLVFKDGKSDKFWKASLSGSSYSVTFGRIGTNGQTQTKEFADDEAAKKAFGKLVDEKLKKGYIDSGEAGGNSAPAAKPAAEVKSPIRRFIHADGSWINLAAVDGHVAQFSGFENSIVPYFRNVKEETFTPPDGHTVRQEVERLAASCKLRKFTEILPVKKPAGETKIDGLWRKLENWLYEHTPAFCRWPLAPPASEREVRAFEKTIGAKLPADIRASYRRHNGSAGVKLLAVVGEGEWVALDEAAEHWKHFQDMRPALEEAGFLEPPKGPMKMVNVSPGWIPIGDSGCGDHLCVDLDPAAGGNFGQLFSHWHEYGAWRIVAPSMTTFLEHLLKHLANGRYAINDKGQLAPVSGPEPEQVEQVQEYFLEGAAFNRRERKPVAKAASGKTKKAAAGDELTITGAHPDRYVERPLLIALEAYVLYCINALSAKKEAAAKRLVQQSWGGGDDWQATVRAKLQSGLELDGRIREQWTFTKDFMEDNKLLWYPLDEAMQVADKYFPKLLP